MHFDIQDLLRLGCFSRFDLSFLSIGSLGRSSFDFGLFACIRLLLLLTLFTLLLDFSNNSFTVLLLQPMLDHELLFLLLLNLPAFFYLRECIFLHFLQLVFLGLFRFPSFLVLLPLIFHFLIEQDIQ